MTWGSYRLKHVNYRAKAIYIIYRGSESQKQISMTNLKPNLRVVLICKMKF